MSRLLLVLTFLLSSFSLWAQTGDVYVDEKGIMRWPNGEELHGFGVNYTVPFAHAYRSAQKLGIDPKEAIDQDVYHFARLGLDAYRVHVWDTEISDTLGNLLVNEHLELFDYLVMKLEERDMKLLITPIAFWGNGWPERDEETPGFSHKYGKAGCLTDPDAIKAQANYLFQFLNHVNAYTGLAYKDDPSVVAFEVSNEPKHLGSSEEVQAYVSKMVQSMMRTGCKKPILYNVSHHINHAEDYYASGIDGGTFQWYPTNLGSREELGGNMLPNVDRYEIPFKDLEGFKQGAKVVYEFDAADVGRSYIYPAMARSFRTAGIQWATHFSYDPTYLAYANTEYDTHYMNLAYAPQKALSLRICSEVFHRIPLYSDFGTFPDNMTFDGFRISYEEDLAELITDEKFIYTNNTKSQVPNPKKLKEIAGFGNSAVVRYEGGGAYFLDQIEKGVWRLEVMPDAVWTKNIFGKNSLDKKVADIVWNSWKMSVQLPDLGNDFSIKGVNKGNSIATKSNAASFEISPGTYLLTKKGKKHEWSSEDVFKNIKIGEFEAPVTTVKGVELVHTLTSELDKGKPLTVKATVISDSPIEKVEMLAYTGYRPVTYQLKPGSQNQFELVIPAEKLPIGALRYFLLVKTKTANFTYPAGIESKPSDWDFHDFDMYETKVFPTGTPFYLFDAARDFDLINMTWNPGVTLRPLPAPNQSALDVLMKDIPVDEANDRPHYAWRKYFGSNATGRSLSNYEKLVVLGKALNEKPQVIELSLIAKDGSIFGALLELGQQRGEYSILLKDLKPTKMVTLPRPYPGFLPYYFTPGEDVANQLDMSQIEAIQVAVSGQDGCHYSIESIRLE
ncbi:membrane or secreted protein [Reichenbachiella ulvae]|uniref:Membrane or secreted protein n=1 Tax=Reichenbachiella ulvae TaxID=2980104 RepID=A0ABT3CTI8_9BACT|nr:membrane or secreted protein [Reichenbachiella ulvae]MCV9387021.1 membrane or secreted protein [Reichenbachiella ulvae]